MGFRVRTTRFHYHLGSKLGVLPGGVGGGDVESSDVGGDNDGEEALVGNSHGVNSEGRGGSCGSDDRGDDSDGHGNDSDSNGDEVVVVVVMVAVVIMVVMMVVEWWWW